MNFRSKKLFLNLLFICGIIFLIGCVIHFYIHFKQTDHIFFITMAGVGTLLFMSSLVLLKKYNAPKKVIENKSNESEKFLKISEERFLLSTEGSGVGIWDWIPRTDVVYYSPYFKKMLGYSEEEFPNLIQSFNHILHPDDYDRLWARIEKHLVDLVPFQIEYRLKNKSGVYRWYRAAGESQRDKNNVAVRMSGSIIDITEMKKIEERLEIQNVVTKALSHGVALQDVSDEIIQGLCQKLQWEMGSLWIINKEERVMRCSTFWSVDDAAFGSFINKTKEISFKLGQGLPGTICEIKRPIWITDIAADKLYRGPAANQVGLHTGMGFPVILKNEVLGVIEFFTKKQLLEDHYLLETLVAIGPQIGQFFQRKTVEDELHVTNAFNSAILESANDTIVAIDVCGKIISCNPQTNAMFEYNANELSDMTITDIIPNWSENCKSLFEKSILELMGATKNGHHFPVEVKYSKMNSNNKEILVLFIRDITERKKIENMKNEFVSVVSHELRTPLTSIRGSLGLILGGTVGVCTDKMNKLLEIANSNCERLLLLINDILDIEKIEAGKMDFSNQIIDVGQVVNKAVLINKPFATRFDIEIVINEIAKNIKVEADPDRLIQVLTNLLSNAIKYSFPNENVIVSIEKNQNTARIAVINKGPGIAEKFRPRIFQKFSQADSTDTRGKGGTGLGLSITKAIVEKLGGMIHFVSEPNKITTFYVDLPLYTKSICANEDLKNELNSLMNQEKFSYLHQKLLVCEDDEDQANFIKALLEPAGFDVNIANSVIQAKKLLKNNTYDALLLDLILPDQDGISFIRELRQDNKTHDLPIIVMSIIAQTGKILLNGDAFTVLDWLDKPVDFKKLLSVIKKIKSKKHELTILHIEDDVDTTVIVKGILGHFASIDSALSIQEALQAIKQKRYNLVILDLILPDGQGADLLPLFSKYHIPVIVYSAYELDEKYGKLVKQALIKSKTSNDELLSTIKYALESDISVGEEYESHS